MGRNAKFVPRHSVFCWCPRVLMHFKKTEVCQTCSKLKNGYQTGLLDLKYGLPLQVCYVGLYFKDDMPKSNINKEYYTQNMEREFPTLMECGQLACWGKPHLPVTCAQTGPDHPYYKWNRPHLCSFWVKGECTRGEECPYRHEKPTDPDDPLADQNIKDLMESTTLWQINS